MRFHDVVWQFDEERALFLEEARELLAALEEGALADPPPIDALFRAAHTLKGSGGMLGLTEWVEAVHALEDALDRVRKGEAVFDATLQKETLRVVDLLRTELDGSPPDPVAAPVPSEPPGDPDPPQVVLTLHWDPGCAMPGVRVLQAWQAVSALAPGAVSDPDPDRLASWSGTTSRLTLPAEVDPSRVEKALSAIPDLLDVEGLPTSTPPAAAAPPAPSGPAAGPAADHPSPPPEGAGRPSEGPRAHGQDATIRVSAETLERVLEGLGELLLDQAQLEHRFRNQRDTATNAVLAHMRSLALELQDTTLRARMLPLDTLFRQYPRAVHDMAQKLGKKIKLVTHGGETELDRIVMDRLHEPLLHLLRNACDHAIEAPLARRQAGKPETGTIRLSAFAAQGHVHVVVEDDGAGIDWDKLRARAVRSGWLSAEEAHQASQELLTDLLFRPGVSTADQITELSGRGVGLDAVRQFLDTTHGTVTVESVLGKGTRIHLELPMTMAIMTALLVEAGPWTLGIPILAVERIEERSEDGSASVLGQSALSDGGVPLPIYPLAALLDSDVEARPSLLVRVRDGRTRAALAVDRVRGQQEVVVKPVPVLASLAPWMTGVSLLGDGRLALMLDVRRLVPTTVNDSVQPVDDGILRVGSNQMELLVFRLSDGQRYGINVYKTREVLPAQPVTAVPNQHRWLEGFLRLRGQTVPVVSLHRALGLPAPAELPLCLITEFNKTVQAFPVDHVERMVRVRWDQVERLPEILEAKVPEERCYTGIVDHPALGPILLVDFEQILAELSPRPPFKEAPGSQPAFSGRSIWVADDSAVARHQVEKALAPLRANVVNFPDGQALWDALPGESPPDLFVLDVEMPRLDGYTLTQRLKQDPRWEAVPVLLHTSLSGHWQSDRVERVGADALLVKFDPDLLARTVAGLLSKTAEASLLVPS